ncbi:MAG: hypothetical protein HON90_12275 [Halobacteriovoraceae bacterium]|jgi:hypothetical protein|nr:hypothetical protein [Halobacteriovoraceae bacterium]
MKKISLTLVLTLVTLLSHANNRNTHSSNNYCLSFEWGYGGYNSRYHLFCGTSGEHMFSEGPHIELDRDFPYMSWFSNDDVLDQLEVKINNLELEDVGAEFIYQREINDSFQVLRKVNSQLVDNYRDYIIVFSVKSIKGTFQHRIISSNGVYSQIKNDDFKKSNLLKMLLKGKYTHIVKGGSPIDKLITNEINVYARH